MKSSLPTTGRCHFCHRPTANRFCRGTSCQRLFWYRQANPVVKQASHSRRSSLTEEERIEAVVERARMKG